MEVRTVSAFLLGLYMVSRMEPEFGAVWFDSGSRYELVALLWRAGMEGGLAQ